MAGAELVSLENSENYKVVQARIRHLWNVGKTTFLIHAKERMTQRKFDVHDIKHILFYGQIVDHSKPKALWRFKVQGKTLDGRSGKCLVEINGGLIIVALYS